jgi:hypothetical protein
LIVAMFHISLMSRQLAAVAVHCSIPTKLFRSPLSPSASKSLSFAIRALISPLPWAQHPAISRGSCTLLACAFTYIKSNAKVGH